MVKQARDQLESNETQELIKEVFEGSCALLRIKPIVVECDKIADNYIPDLIDTLASEMNPQVVCSVAGLCNNARVLQLIAETGIEAQRPKAYNRCNGCHTVVSLLQKKFDGMSRDEVLQSFLRVCRDMGSFSDSCSNVIISYFTDIYAHISQNLNPTDVCLMAGECSAQFHTHVKNVDITPMSHVGFVNKQDDLPCELCEQLVVHLRDMLVANTTESEFKMVLEGLCKQTQGFKEECLGIVDEYYEKIYYFLANGLNGTVACSLIDICPAPGNNYEQKDVPLYSLLNHKNAEKAKNIMGVSATDLQLPIERVMPQTVQELYNEQACAFCEYLLHYIQMAITNPSTEQEIKDVVYHACDRLPRSVNQTCVEFVNTYGDAFVAILAQEIDPSTICPLIHVCPARDSKDVEIFMQQPTSAGNCPLCLFAVTKLEEMVKDKKTEENIKQALDNLCSHLTNNLAKECVDFVNTYTNELIEMLEADLTPQEVCVYLKLCNDTKPAEPLPAVIKVTRTDIEDNEIFDQTIGGVEQDSLIEANEPESLDEIVSSPQCILCEFVMKEIEDRLKNKNDEEEVKKIVHDVCNFMPGTVRKDCNDFVNKYADTVIQLLIASLQPNEICSVMSLCSAKNDAVKNEILECAMCEAAVEAMYKILNNPNAEHDMEHVLEKGCRALPKRNRKKCTDLIELYGDELFQLVSTISDKREICAKLNMCSAAKVQRPQMLVGTNKCTWGPGYWCKNLDNAKECGTLQHCQERVWLAEMPSNP